MHRGQAAPGPPRATWYWARAGDPAASRVTPSRAAAMGTSEAMLGFRRAIAPAVGGFEAADLMVFSFRSDAPGVRRIGHARSTPTAPGYSGARGTAVGSASRNDLRVRIVRRGRPCGAPAPHRR